MYALVQGGDLIAYPYSDFLLRRDHPNVSFPAVMDDGTRAAFGMIPVEPTAVPPGKVAVATTAELVEGVWTESHTLEDHPPPPIPSVVTMRQARLALLAAGLLSQVDNVIDGLEEPGRSAARIEWEYATELRRNHPLVAALGSALELTEQQIDDLFLAASEIE